MRKWRYRLLGVSGKEKLVAWAIRFLKSGLLYFMIVMIVFIRLRGVKPLQKFNNSLVLNTYEIVEFSNKYNTDIPCNDAENTIEYNRQQSQNGGSFFKNTSLLDKDIYRDVTKLIDAIPLESSNAAESSASSYEPKPKDNRIAFGTEDGRGYTIEEFNSLGKQELLMFHGIGPVTAERILQLREARGGFGSFDELMDVKGIGPAKLKKIMGEEDEVNGAH